MIRSSCGSMIYGLAPAVKPYDQGQATGPHLVFAERHGGPENVIGASLTTSYFVVTVRCQTAAMTRECERY